MISCVFDRATGVFVGGHRDRAHEFDPATQVRIDLDQWPDRESERWDGAQGVRPAEPQEMADAEDGDKERRVHNIEPILLAVLLALNDGSLPVGQNLTRAKIKTAIKAAIKAKL